MAATLALTSVESRSETPSARTFFFGLEQDGLDYLPGQYITIRLEGLEDPRGPQRPFTLSSSPTEGRRIHITTRMTGSPFKQALQKIANEEDGLEQRIKVRGPLGSFTLDMERPAVMIAGGIGITPFRSMIRYLADQKAGLPIVLLYSNNIVSDIAFRDELDTVAEKADWLSIIHTITRTSEIEHAWSGRTGRIDSELITEAADHLDNPIYYVCGPPGMVTGMAGIIQSELSVPESDLRVEKFTGYP